MRPIEQVDEISVVRRELLTQLAGGRRTKTASLARAKRFRDDADAIVTEPLR